MDEWRLNVLRQEVLDSVNLLDERRGILHVRRHLASSYIMELDLKELSRWYGKKRTFQPISKFQEEKRDLAFVMDKNISCGDVENCIREANKYVKEIRLFDVYEGGQIPEGKKSMAFTVTFAPKEEAFDFEKVQKFVEKICKKLQNEFNIELRG